MALVIGIDLGGTKIKGILVEPGGAILNSIEKPTQAETSKKQIFDNILDVINRLRAPEVQSIGLSIPGFMLPNGKMACMPNTRRIEGLKLKALIEKKTKLKVFIENDANCFALAEQRKGAAKNCRNILGVIIGTGVGTGIIINNQVYRGAIGSAGECGHTKLVINNETNGERVIKEIEELISGPAIVRRYEELSNRKADSPAVIMDKKDEAAKKVYEEFVLYTGLFFANLMNTFNPEMIVVGGGVSNLDFYKDVQKIVNKYAVPELAKACKIRKNVLGDDSGVIGAALLPCIG